MQTLQAVQVKQMQQPQANQPTQAPTQGNPVLMQSTQQQNVQQMMPPQGNVSSFSKIPLLVPNRDEHFSIFEKLVFAIISRILRILMEHVESICSLEA